MTSDKKLLALINYKKLHVHCVVDIDRSGTTNLRRRLIRHRNETLHSPHYPDIRTVSIIHHYRLRFHLTKSVVKKNVTLTKNDWSNICVFKNNGVAWDDTPALIPALLRIWSEPLWTRHIKLIAFSSIMILVRMTACLWLLPHLAKQSLRLVTAVRNKRYKLS